MIRVNQELTFSIIPLIAREELKTIVKRIQPGRRASAKEGKSISHAHPLLVSEEIFQKANMIHSKCWRLPTIKYKKLSNPLAGILLCELCGYSMLYQPRKDRPNPQVRCVQPSCKGIQKGASLALVE
ncbi:hypothetical protein AT274_04290 [Bacillus cereus]|uniref:Recombinase zinc beta ribbon domain-containing protein n=1 Tax=Bacillus cereus TaxID=1396 RepID=A0A150B2I4_BACCE|nr:hypothetical protein AT274_04290 [Bacillus cereus]KXY01730.1 hypothetical protein AT271_01185 [Bacillus cereus]